MKRFPDRWWKQADAEMGRAITAMVSRFRAEPEYAGREALHAEALSRYNGRGVGVGPRGYRTEAIGRHDVPLCYERSLCETVLSQIAAAQRPKASFLTTAGDWKTRRRSWSTSARIAPVPQIAASRKASCPSSHPST